MTRPRCGNDPRAQVTDGDRQAVENFRAYLAERAALRDRIAAAIWERQNPGRRWADCEHPWGADAEEDADAVLAVLPPHVSRADVYRQAADELDAAFGDPMVTHVGKLGASQLRRRAREIDAGRPDPRRMADEAQPAPAVDLATLAAALDGLHTLIATSSRDWGQYRVDAWLWAVLCGWDCEQAEHDDTCTHGALEEMQQRHGWSDEAVAKARRYRAAVRALVQAQQDGAQP